MFDLFVSRETVSIVHAHTACSSSLSQGALQCVVVVLETFEFQEVFGPLAALASGGQVGDLNGGGSTPDRRACQVLGCRLVMLVQAGAAGISFHPVKGEGQRKGVTMLKGFLQRTGLCKYNIITINKTALTHQQVH